MFDLPYSAIHFLPKMQCRHCPRWTTVAILDPCFVESFNPECPLHGYVLRDHPQNTSNDEGLRQQQASIERFVLWMYDNMGRVTLISPVHDLTTIPGYERAQPEDFGYGPDEIGMFRLLHNLADEAWYVGYKTMQDESKELHVVWSWDYDQFFLYRDGEQVNDVEHLPI